MASDDSYPCVVFLDLVRELDILDIINETDDIRRINVTPTAYNLMSRTSIELCKQYDISIFVRDRGDYR